MPSELCEEEIETLKAIYMSDMSFESEGNGNDQHLKLSMVLYPSTGDDEEAKYVTLTLEITLPPLYPDQIPVLTVRNPRGLSEEALGTLQERMLDKSKELVGSQMIFELIQMTRDFLTENNKPSSECPICLMSFSDFDVFFRTHCFHYFHSHCLGRFLKSFEEKEKELEEDKREEPSCPVCRVNFEELDADKLYSCPPPAEEEEDDVSGSTGKLGGDQSFLQSLYEKQKRQGGIIDLSEKAGSTLIISSPTSTASTHTSSSTTVAPSGPTTFVTVGNGHSPRSNSASTPNPSHNVNGKKINHSNTASKSAHKSSHKESESHETSGNGRRGHYGGNHHHKRSK